MAGLFEDILENIKKVKGDKPGKFFVEPYFNPDGSRKIVGGYGAEDRAAFIEKDKEGIKGTIQYGNDDTDKKFRLTSDGKNTKGEIVFKFADGGSTNGSGEKAFTAKVKELMDDGYELGEAVKEAMRQGYVDGGTVDFFKKNYKIKLRGDETAQEIKYLKELMEEFTENIPNLKGKNKLGPYMAGKKSNLQSLAKSYAEYGKENIEKVASDFGIDYKNAGTDARRKVNKQTAKQYPKEINPKDIAFLKKNEKAINESYEKALKKYVETYGKEPSGARKANLKAEATNRVLGREKSNLTRNEVIRNKGKKVFVQTDEVTGLKTFKFTDPKLEAEFIKDLKYRNKFPGGGGDKAAKSYADKAGALTRSEFQKKYFPDLAQKTVDDIMPNYTKVKGITKKPSLTEFITKQQDAITARLTKEFGKTPRPIDLKKAMKEAGLKSFINEKGVAVNLDIGNQAAKIKNAARDPERIITGMNKSKIGSNLDIQHGIKKQTLDTPRKVGASSETLEDLYLIDKNLNRGKKFPGSTSANSRINIAEDMLQKINVKRDKLIDANRKIIKGKESEFYKLQAKGQKIAREYSQADELFGVKFKGAPGKSSGATNVKGVLDFEIFSADKDGVLKVAKKVGGDKAKSLAGVTDNLLAKKAFNQASKLEAKQIIGQGGREIAKRIKNGEITGAALGSICKAITAAGMASGGSAAANCLRAIEDNPARAISAIAKISKASGKLRGAVSIAKNVAKATGYGLLAEVAFAAPFAIADLRAGESGKRIIGNATLGLVGDTVTDEQKEFMGEKGYRAYELEKANNALNALGMSAEESFSPDDDMLISERLTQADNTFNKKMQPYIMEDGTFNETQFNQDYGIAQAGLKNIEDVKKMRRDKIQEGIRNRIDPYANDFMAADGGIAALPREVANPTNYGIFGTKVYNN